MDKRKKEILDALLEKASTLEKEMPIYVEISKDVTPTNKDGKEVMENEFYTRGNEGKSDGDVNTLEPEKDFVRLTVPAGEKIAYIEDDGKSLLLLRRNATYHITKITEVNDDSGNSHNIYEAELIPKTEKVAEVKNFQTDNKAATEWAKQAYEKWPETLTRNELDKSENPKNPEEAAKTEWAALKYYSGNGYSDINYYLRSGGRPFKNPSLESVIEKLDSGLNKAKTPETLIVYRRVDEVAFGWKANTLATKDGKLIPDKIEEFIKKIQFSNQRRKGLHEYSAI
ncbi:ADP-ribosyltransferase [Bacillus cereus]